MNVTEILNEALEVNADQVLMISRSKEARLYFLSNGRVRKGMAFDKDIPRALFNSFGRDSSPSVWSPKPGRQFSLSCKTVPNEIGECLSLTIREIEAKK